MEERAGLLSVILESRDEGWEGQVLCPSPCSPAQLPSPIPPYNKVCTSHTPAASQGLHYITVGLLLLLPSLPGNRHRPLPATIHTAT